MSDVQDSKIAITKKPGKGGFVSAAELMAQVKAQGGGAKVEIAEEMPWVSAHPKLKVHFGLRLSEQLHKKFEYAANHTLGASMQSFALDALEKAVEQRLKELGVL